MADQNMAPVTWAHVAVNAVAWPAVVASAFWLGRYVKDLEHRLVKAETNLTQLVERHMPAVHRALAEIRGLLLSRGNK